MGHEQTQSLGIINIIYTINNDDSGTLSSRFLSKF